MNDFSDDEHVLTQTSSVHSALSVIIVSVCVQVPRTSFSFQQAKS
jgi:hypothetical protein